MGAYTTTAWRTTRQRYLATHQHCIDCGGNATQPDHTPPRVLLVALGVHDPDHERWLRARCASCHATKTQLVDAPLITRMHAGDDIHALANEATQAEAEHRHTTRPTRS